MPLAIFLLLVFGVPLVDALRRSVTSFVLPQTQGLDNYEWFFDSSVNLVVLWRTFRTALLVTVIALCLAYPYAYLMTLVGPRWRAVMIAVVLLPFWTSLLVRTYSWIVLLQDGGVVSDALDRIGLGGIELSHNIVAVTIGMVQILLPFMVLPLYVCVRGIDRRLLLAAQGLGATPMSAWARVYVPLSLPGVLAGSLLVFVLALGFFITPALLGSPQDALLSQLIATQVTELLAFGRAGAMAAVLLATTLLALGLVARATHHLTGRLGGAADGS